MNDEEKMVWLYEQVHGPVSPRNSCQIRVNTTYDNEHYNPVLTLEHVKNGHVFSTQSKADLLFDYVTRKVTPV